MNKEVAIQFVNYNTGAYLKDAIQSVRHDLAASTTPYVFYVYNNSPEEQLTWIDESDTHLITAEKNVGFGAGHNRLLQLHDAELTFILNPDIRIVEPETIARMIASFGQRSSVGCLGVWLISEDKKQQAWDHGELDYSERRDSPTSTYEERDSVGEVAWVSGADSLVQTAAVKSLSGFDEQFFLYKEEEDLCLRLRHTGFKTYYDPTISILHVGSVVANKDSDDFGRSINYFNKKHHVDTA